MRDAIDSRIIDDVVRRGYTFRGSIDNLPGIIDSQSDVGGYPNLKTAPAPADRDHDGLPDWWETDHGLNPDSLPADDSDTNGDPDQDGYTNLDDYLEYLAHGGLQFKTYHCAAAILCDFDGDCMVGLEDYGIFAEAWSSHVPPADLNGDLNYNVSDIALFARQWLENNRIEAFEGQHESPRVK
jgi:hypothetical protein